MRFQPASSRQRYGQYIKDLARRRAEGSAPGEPVPLPGSTHSHRARPRTRSAGQLVREFFRLLRGHRLVLAACLVTVTISALLSLVSPAATKIVVDYVLTRQPVPHSLQDVLRLPSTPDDILLFVAIAIIAIETVSIAISMWGRWQATRLTHLVRARVRRHVFDHAMNLPLYRVQQLKTGGLTSILREDTGGIGDLIFVMLYNPTRAIVQLIGCLVILALVDWRLLLGSLILLPLVWMTHRTWINRIRPLYRDIHITRQETDSHATEAFGGVRVVRGFARQKSESGRFARNNHFRSRQEVNVWWWSRGVDIAWAILIPTASAALLWYGGRRVLDGAITVGDLVMFLAYLAMLLAPMATLATSATQFQTYLAGLDRVLDLMQEPEEMPDRPDAISVRADHVGGRMTLRDVAFQYPGSTQIVLDDINLDVLPGEMIAFVGPSGSGKSTLCNLIARFYDPTRGTIELDGTDLRDITLRSFRSLLGIVEQDIFLFDGTVAQNVGYGRRDAGLNEIIEAARLANAHDFITELERGYDTIIGERGVRLSGGQRQRLAIARALLADPRILILDEATSNLDTESERLIQTSLQTLMAGRTCFVIAHRLSTIAHADRIVVLERGRIIEQGTHFELMQRSGRYEQMVSMQCHPAMSPQPRQAPAAQQVH